MESRDKLKNTRNLLLKQHKQLLDMEREAFEQIHGPVTSGQWLNVIIDDPDLAWLRKFSMLIVEIDEMFDLKDAIEPGMVEANLEKIRGLVAMEGADDYFKSKYENGLQTNPEVADLDGQIWTILNQ